MSVGSPSIGSPPKPGDFGMACSWPYAVPLPTQVGLLFNLIERIDLEQGIVALVLATRPLPSCRTVFWWCDSNPRLISFPLPDNRAVGKWWTIHGGQVTLELFPPDLLILPLQKPNGKWFSPSAVTCSIVQALAMKETSKFQGGWTDQSPVRHTDDAASTQSHCHPCPRARIYPH